MKKNVLQKVMKSTLAFTMMAVFASPTTIFANDVATTEENKETTETVVDPGIDTFEDIFCTNGVSIDEPAPIGIVMKNNELRDVIGQFYTFEWILGDKFVMNEDQSDIEVSDVSVIGRELGLSPISVKITSRSDATITKTLTKDFDIRTTKAVFRGTKDKIDVEEILKNMDTGKYVSYGFNLDPAVNPVISKKIIAKAKEKGIDLDFTIYNGETEIGWYWLQVADIVNTDIDFNVSVSIDIDTKEITDEFSNKYKPLIIDFKHEGILPGKTNIILWINDWYKTNFGESWVPELYLYHINEETQKLEPAGTVNVTQGLGYGIRFDITHCSKYALTETELTEAELDLKVNTTNEVKQELDNQPNTGV